MNSLKTLSPRLIVVLMMAISGAVFFFAFLAEDLGGPSGITLSDIPTGLLLRYIFAMAAGGALAGFLLSGWFGRRGFLGGVLALLGAIVAALIAGLFGSAIGLAPDILADGWQMKDIIPIGMGAAIVPLAFVSQPILLLPWLTLLVITQIWTKAARQRQTSSAAMA